MTDVQKKEIIALLDKEVDLLGSQRRVAKMLGVSDSVISQMRQGGYDFPETWADIGTKLGYKTEGWQLVEIMNAKMMMGIMQDAKDKSMFIAVSHKAGSGKSASIKIYEQHTHNKAVFVIIAREWARREFLLNLAQRLGVMNEYGNYVSVDKLGQKIVEYFNQRYGMKPLLVIDEADKLRPSALRWLITLYNQTEDNLGAVLVGTENLEKEVKRGVKLAMKGFDELDSRLGRVFLHLTGATFADVEAICAANGLSEKTKQQAIFKECGPVTKMIGNKQITVIEDLRRLKRVIQREQLLS